VEPWLATHPQFTPFLLPTDCPRANPIGRALGDVHDLCTRYHRRKRLLVADRAKLYTAEISELAGASTIAQYAKHVEVTYALDRNTARTSPPRAP
jgi:hypothetical protein